MRYLHQREMTPSSTTQLQRSRYRPGRSGMASVSVSRPDTGWVGMELYFNCSSTHAGTHSYGSEDQRTKPMVYWGRSASLSIGLAMTWLEMLAECTEILYRALRYTSLAIGIALVTNYLMCHMGMFELNMSLKEW